MSEAPVNKRAGREDELRRKLKETTQRFEDVFGTPLTTDVLESFLLHSERALVNGFLTDRVGVLSDMDIKYLRRVVKENTKGVKIKDPLPDQNALEEELSDSLDEIDSDSLEDLSA